MVQLFSSVIQINIPTITLESLVLTAILILLSVIILLIIKSKNNEYSVLIASKLFQRQSNHNLSRQRVSSFDKIEAALMESIYQDERGESDEAAEYEIKVHEFNVKLKDKYSHVKEFDPFAVFEEMKKMQIRPDVTTFNTLIDICFSQQRHDIAFKLFECLKSIASEEMIASNEIVSKEAKEKALAPDIITYNTILKGLARQINEKRQTHENKVILNKIFKTMKEIPSYDLKANEITYNTVLDACVKLHDLELAFEYFDKMKNEGLQPDNFTYSTLIKGIKNQHTPHLQYRSPVTDTQEISTDKRISTGNHKFISAPLKQTYNLNKVFEILTSMKQEYYFKPDEVLFNCVIDACVKFRNLPKALEVFHEMENIGLKPSGNTYSVLIKGFGNARQFDNLMKMFHKMQQDQIKLSEITYGCLIDACMKCNRFDQAMAFFNMMKQEPETKINNVIYGILIKGFTSSRNFDQAFEVFSYMLNSQDAALSIVTFNTMLECAIKCNKSFRFFEVYDMISSAGGKVQPDLITYSTYIKGLCKFGQVEKALNIYYHIRQSNLFKMDEVLFNSLLHGLQKAREFEKAIEIHQEMIEAGISPSHVTYSIMIKVYADQLRIDDALDLFDQVKKISLPTIILYTCIIQSCIKCKKLSKVIQLYHEMRSYRIRGNYHLGFSKVD